MCSRQSCRLRAPPVAVSVRWRCLLFPALARHLEIREALDFERHRPLPSLQALLLLCIVLSKLFFLHPRSLWPINTLLALRLSAKRKEGVFLFRFLHKNACLLVLQYVVVCSG